MSSLKILKQALNATRTFSSMSNAALNTLLAKTKEAASQGFYEKFKTSARYGGMAKNLEWLGLVG